MPGSPKNTAGGPALSAPTDSIETEGGQDVDAPKTNLTEDLGFLKSMLGDVIKAPVGKVDTPETRLPILTAEPGKDTDRQSRSQMTIEERLAFLEMLTKGRDGELDRSNDDSSK